ncbi:MAG: Eco57I restriction-modification methylase domain-containing protein [Bacteroidota bacterium]
MKNKLPGASSIQEELPSQFADQLGVEYASSVDQSHKKRNGQFFTPVEIAAFMASLSDFNGDSVRILDPGCGSGVLSCALIEKLVDSNSNLKYIELVGYETEQKLFSTAHQSFEYLKEWLLGNDISMEFKLHNADFVLHNADAFKESRDLFSKEIEPFDIIISNPPYFKISINDKRTVVSKVVINGHPNIYAIFMALSAKMLKENGELIFITPRSYAAGNYFKQFRTYFFNLIDLQRAHLFVSRKDTFSRDKVLQETVIIKGTRNTKQERNTNVIVSSSGGLKDLQDARLKTFSKRFIIDIHSDEKILYLPTSEHEGKIVEVFKKWSGTLHKYNIKISTGPVVAFRSWDHIKNEYNDDNEIAPLFWMHNVKKMILEWPIVKPNKGQYITVNEKSKSILIPNKNYIFLRRFSSKDDKNRLIAAPYFCNYINSNYIGVENKVNYIYRPNGHLERNEVVGLCALLNSSLFDEYFRIFNGNVNVSATELREMTLPSLDMIKEIGDTIILSNDFSMANINTILDKYFEPTIVHE